MINLYLLQLVFVEKLLNNLLFQINKKLKIFLSAKPKSPTLFTTKAFIAAAFALSFLNQKPIKKYEHKPTPSQPKNNCIKLSEVTTLTLQK